MLRIFIVTFLESNSIPRFHMGSAKSALGMGGDKPVVRVKSLYEFKSVTAEGSKPFDFEQLRGKVVLVSNVASKCGLTDGMYKTLGGLAQKYGPTGKFVVLGFPCAQFMNQEFKDPEQTCPFVRNLLGKFGGIQDQGYFNLMEKVNVNGENTHEIFHFLKYNSPLYNEKKNLSSPISWNFGKFLIDTEGRVIKYYAPTDDKLEADVEQAIAGSLQGSPVRPPTQ
jgi:glutathione peroxidase-family protein